MDNTAEKLPETANSRAEAEVLSTFPGDLYVKNVHKAFGVTKALNGVSFTGYFGEIHAVIGGNGCGKSTLAKVLAGVLPIDSGKVSIKGHHPTTPGESRAIGVSMVFQEVLVADESSVVDNLFIGSDGFFSKSMSDKEKERKARSMMSELAGEEVDPLVPAGTLPLSIKAWITIARGLLCEPDVLILDESSAALDFDSTERLFNKMRELRDRGSAIIIVTHRIAELIRISDRCTVMRDGVDVGVLEKSEITEENLLRLMTGKSQTEKPRVGDAHVSTSQEVMVNARDMLVWREGERVNFDLRKGEIIGITGLDGHGQDDFVRIIAGVKNAADGFISVRKKNGEGYTTVRTLEEAKMHEIAFVSGDRKREGILPNLSIFENLLFPLYQSYSRLPGVRLIDWFSLRDMFDWEVERLAIKTGPQENLITSLSGGNQQKVMLGRAFATHPSTLVLLDPARGIDLHTKRDLYKQLREFASEGGSVVYMSSELEEFIGFCSRVLVFRNGSIFEEFVDEKVEPVGILESMFGRSQSGVKPGKPVKPKPTLNEEPKSIQADNRETPMTKYNISPYFREEPKQQTTKRTGVYSEDDEAQFEKLLQSGSRDIPVRDFHSSEETEQPVDVSTSAYAASDEKHFEQVMQFSNRVRKNTDAQGRIDYSENDELQFANLMQANKEVKNQSSIVSKPERTVATGDKENSEPEAASDHDYSEHDLRSFQHLMSGIKP